MNCSDESARGGPDRLHIGGVLVHGAPGAERVGRSPEVVASPRAVGGVESLFVGPRAGRRAAERALARDHHIHVAAPELDGGPKSGRAASEDQRLGSMRRQGIAARAHEALSAVFRSPAAASGRRSIRRGSIAGAVEAKGVSLNFRVDEAPESIYPQLARSNSRWRAKHHDWRCKPSLPHLNFGTIQ